MTSLNAAVDRIFSCVASRDDKTLRMATPLGLGKPNVLLNEIYRRVKATPGLKLEIYTALSLDPPSPGRGVEQRFLAPFVERFFGPSYPSLDYVRDLKRQALPANVRICEFYVEAGAYKHNPIVQSEYASLNYTQVVQSLVAHGVEVIPLLISKRGERYSLSTNPDLTLDLYDALRKAGRRFMVVGVVHPDMPFLGGEAEVSAEFFDVIVDSEGPAHELFAIPRSAIDATDYMIGLHASRLVPDDGTLQIGIGSLSDALVYSLIQRQEHNATYRHIIDEIGGAGDFCLEPFEHGLYGLSEMVMDGFMHLRKAGILKRKVAHDGRQIFLEGAFCLGSKPFYEWLRTLSEEDFAGFSMSRISRVNNLFDREDQSARAQRQKARFFNTCMNVTLLGGAASDTLADGRVVSGVGGQYNFVAMAHELDDAHSILMLRSTSYRDGHACSNIVPAHGHLTIPRHLRDVVITEYGVASLRGKSDGEVVRELLEITDSRFQESLRQAAVKAGKLSADYRISEKARRLNNPQSVKERVARYQKAYSWFPDHPFGSDFTAEELRLGKALRRLAKTSWYGKLASLGRGLGRDRARFRAELERMGLVDATSCAERLLARLIMGSLS